ncbi:hypothetical protein CDD83_9300 [Cordyceps sp. RAO-2017]|nr:hypothetical protein CDD83_9300 [Cordyceps sp. RAO-2017]
MKFSILVAAELLLSLASAATNSTGPYTFDRLNKNDSVLLIVDHQEGLFSVARDFDATSYRQQILAHASLGRLFNLPVVITSSIESGPNGPILSGIRRMYPNTTIIRRQGEVDAWDNAQFRNAVRATGKSQVILAGITTDSCTTFLSLSLRQAGYAVWANAEASGSSSKFVRDLSNDRMSKAGVQVVSLFSIVTDLMRDWRATPGARQVIPWLATWYPAWGEVAEAHSSAVRNGTAVTGEDVL